MIYIKKERSFVITFPLEESGESLDSEFFINTSRIIWKDQLREFNIPEYIIHELEFEIEKRELWVD